MGDSLHCTAETNKHRKTIILQKKNQLLKLMRRNNQEPTLPLVRLYLFLHSSNPKLSQHLKKTRTIVFGFFLDLQRTGIERWVVTGLEYIIQVDLTLELSSPPTMFSPHFFLFLFIEQCYVSFRCIPSDLMFAYTMK